MYRTEYYMMNLVQNQIDRYLDNKLNKTYLDIVSNDILYNNICEFELFELLHCYPVRQNYLSQQSNNKDTNMCDNAMIRLFF